MKKIVIENLCKRVNHFNLSGVSFSVHSGEIFALVGMTGSGKSTITKILDKLIYTDSGTATFDHQDTGVLVQDQEFYKNKTVFKTMLMFSETYPKQIRHSEIRNTLRAVGLYKRRNTRVKDLTINRYARLKIALSIMTRPSILILDDPFVYLNDYESREVRVILRTLSERFDTAILITATDFTGIEEIFDTTAIIDGGQIVCIESYNTLSRMNDKDSKISISTPTANLAAVQITEKFGYDVNLFEENEIIISAHPDKAQEIHDYLTSQEIEVTSITRVNKSIEHLFHQLRTRSYGGTL